VIHPFRGAALALAVVAPPLGAQSFGARAAVAFVREAVGQGGATRLRSGATWGGEGAFGLGPVVLSVRYLQGSIDSATGTTPVDYVEGQALLMIRPVRWLAAGFGPHARSFIEPGGTQRWLMWEVHGQGFAPLVGSLLEAYLEGWAVVGSSIDLVESLDHGLGIEGGMRVALGRLPVSVRVRYRSERLALGSGLRQETHEQIALAVGIGRR
jgi:hypothetical protein